MKAIRVHEYGGPAVMKLEDAPDPALGPGDVVVRVRAAGVNPVDAYIHTGTYARKPALPYTPGQDGAGDVHSVGANVKEFKPGDRVYISGVGNTVAGAGTYAELALCSPSMYTGQLGSSPVPGRLMPMLAAFDSPGPLTTQPMTASVIVSTPSCEIFHVGIMSRT